MLTLLSALGLVQKNKILDLIPFLIRVSDSFVARGTNISRLHLTMFVDRDILVSSCLNPGDVALKAVLPPLNLETLSNFRRHLSLQVPCPSTTSFPLYD